ncbi:replication fork protection component Swi3-domain-containing protein [Amylostereum chailletii]|nr:replication fork protection component Swi3-domain-containing protein [Amylostereum chailletii]
MASTELENIWDLPEEPYVSPPSTTTIETDIPVEDHVDVVSRKPKPPLFLSSDDEDDTSAPRRVSLPSLPQENLSLRPDIDALFEDVEDDGFQELAPALDLDALRRAADARHAPAARVAFSSQIPSRSQVPTQGKRKGKGRGNEKDVLGADGEGDEGDEVENKKKKRKPLPKLNEERLLGKDGFPQLVKDTKHFMPKGKGRELEDLDRAMQMYQFWSHRMYPKMRFKETVQRVALSVWRDEAKGLIHGQKLSDPEDDVIDLTDGEGGAAQKPRGSSSVEGAPTQPATVINLDDDDDDDDDEGALSGPASRPPTLPPSSPISGPEENYDDMDLDAILEADAAASAAVRQSSSSTTAFMDAHAPNITDDDEAMWDAIDMDTQNPKVASDSKQPAPQLDLDDDEDMWDVVREVEMEGKSRPKVATNKPCSVGAAQALLQAEEDEWESMYA